MRILAIATNPATAASTRFRVLQWVPHLERAGFSLTLDAFFSPAGAEMLYRPGHRLAKAAYIFAGLVRRSISLARAARTSDFLLIHREAFPLGQRLLFGRLRRFPGAIVYDYDDAMFLPQREGRGLLARLERLDTPREVMRLSRMVLAGNRFLADYAREAGARVVLLPTCIDTEKFRPQPRPKDGDGCVVGWIGSHTTAKYLYGLLPVLERVGAERPFRLRVVGAPWSLRTRALDIAREPWSLEREVEDFATCDIGIYPLWADRWSDGKCGFKAIQFMACGVPVVASAASANRDIIEDGVNGFLAATEHEWAEKLGWLLTDPKLREKLGEAGRRTIEERYSLSVNAPTLLGALDEACRGRERRR